jgi:FkbM family methyltransferase
MKIISLLFFSIYVFNLGAKNYVPFKNKDFFYKDPYGVGSYLDHMFVKHINSKLVNSIVEIGSRDCIDAVRLSNFFKTHVYAFECNPVAIDICLKNLQNNPNVTLVPLAIWDETKQIPFFPTSDTNLGASSCFKFVEKGYGKECHPGLSQYEIEVPAIRMDEWMFQSNIENFDLICMDTQGATLKILKSFGDRLKKSKYIITEGCIVELYQEEDLFPDIHKYLEDMGFQLVEKKENNFFGDYLYINKNI